VGKGTKEGTQDFIYQGPILTFRTIASWKKRIHGGGRYKSKEQGKEKWKQCTQPGRKKEIKGGGGRAYYGRLVSHTLSHKG